jgi:anti-sigma factor RsiW
MNINRHNYEEHFILYMDNELSSDERRMVEAFVQQHPDLQEELDILLQYKLVPDTNITFTGKEELMKVNLPVRQAGGDTPVTLTNYEEWLVLYMDNELSGEQKVTVEQFIANNSSVKEELALLQRTKLQPEEIIFADKASLYRREEKVRSMPVRWWRLAVAAVLLLGVGITTAILVNKKSTAGSTEIVKGTTPEKKTTPENPPVILKESNSPVNENIVANNNQSTSPVLKQAGNNNTIAKEKNNAVKNQLPTIVTTNRVKEEPVVATTNKPTNDLPVPLNNPNIIRNDATNKSIASDNTSKENKEQNPLTNPVVTTQNPSSSDIVYASNNNTDADFDQPDSKKNKNRGFFRKLARTFEKRTDIDPTDDNKLLVAGLAIKLK